MALSSLREKVILTIIILTTDCTNGYIMSETWYQKGVLAPSLVQDHTYHWCWCNTRSAAPCPLCWRGRCGPIAGRHWECVTSDGGKGVEQDLIPYVGQLELSSVPVKGWVIDPDVYGLLYGPCNVVCLPTHHGEVVHTDVMLRDVAMFIDRWRGPEVSLRLSPKVLVDSPVYSSLQSSLSHLFL